MARRARPAALLLCAVMSLALCSCAPRMESITLGVGKSVFTVEVARTDAERARGLMYRSKLPPLGGMLFVFDADQRLEFWMKNTRIPLSIAFLSSTGKVTEIRDLRPYSEEVVRSRIACRYALEVNAGAFAQAGVGEGDTISFPAGFR